MTWLLLFSFTSVLFIITCVAGGLISNFMYHTEGLSFSVLTDASVFIFTPKCHMVSLGEYYGTMHKKDGQNYVINIFVHSVLHQMLW